MLMRCYRDGTTGRVTGPDGTPTWFATGDAGYLTEDGTLSVVGRIADMITTGGENVWPDEVERVLSTHDNVAEVAVWKRPDPEWGERVVAWVVATGDIPHVEELKYLVATTIAPWAAPKEVVFTARATPDPFGQGLAPRPDAERSRQSAPVVDPARPGCRAARLRLPHPRPDPRASSAVPGPSPEDCP